MEEGGVDDVTSLDEGEITEGNEDGESKTEAIAL